LYVDDILGIVDEKEAKKLKEYLVKRFGTVLFKEGGRLSYLGMDVEITDAGTKINMSFYVKQLMQDAEAKKTLMVCDSPGTKELDICKEEEQKLENEQRVYVHSTVAKLLYLAKRARPDILTVVIFMYTLTECYNRGQKKLVGYWAT
jgi:hypothetical protein